MTRGLRLTDAQLAAIQGRRTAKSAPEAPRKHRNQPTVSQGIRFDSKHEARVWADLQLREKAGQIAHLQRQVSFPVTIDGTRIQRVRLDFWYWENGRIVVADAKSAHTASLNAWKRTKALMLACYGLEVVEL